MGLHKAIKPMFPKEFVRPASMIKSTANSFKALARTQDTAKASAYPLIHGRKGPFMAMFEVFKPATKGTVDVIDNVGQAMAIATTGLDPDGVFDFSHALLAWPTSAPLKVVPKEVKSFSGNRDIYQPGLFRVKDQPSSRGQLPQKVQCPMGLGLAATHNHEVICVADQLIASLTHGHVNRVQIDVRKKGADHRPLRTSLLRCPPGQSLQDFLLEEGFQQPPHSSICNILANVGQQRAMGNAVKGSYDILPTSRVFPLE
jgi:hypothetical protein